MEMNSVLNMLTLLSLVYEIPEERCREGFGYVHLELSRDLGWRYVFTCHQHKDGNQAIHGCG